MSDSLNRTLAALRKADFSGYCSACFFLLAALLVIDGLQALMREDFSRIDLPLGEQVLLSGAMPLEAKNHADIIAIIEGNDGLSFTPLTDFKGHWFGAHMWRGALDAGKATDTGRAVLTIVDMVPAKSTSSNATIMVQNPNQIFTVTVWPSAEAMRAAHFSLVHRLTGLSTFILAALSLACALGIGVWHYFLSRAAHRALALEGIYPIYGRKKTEEGYLAFFSPGDRLDLQARQPAGLLSPQGEERQKGMLYECSPKKYSALFSLDEATAPRHGWLIHCEPKAGQAPERGENTPA
jgi:hypothetical protein